MAGIFPGRPLTTISIQVPNGTTQHDNEHILCLPITKSYWPSVAGIIIFFATNYLAHAATVKSSPGDDVLVQACNAILALCFPMSGLLRALNAIVRFPVAAENEVDKACRAGALCMVVRAPHWRPKLGQVLQLGVVPDRNEPVITKELERQPNTLRAEIRFHNEVEGLGFHESYFRAYRAQRIVRPPIQGKLITYIPSYARENSSRWVHFDSVWARSRVDLRLTRVHGTFELPDGYEFATVPRNTYLLSQVASSAHQNRTYTDPKLTSEMSAGYSILKAVASLIQVIAAFMTLLSHRPDLIRRWGYASYHLTVIPYLVMTLVNLICNLITPDYPCLYMVRSETMVEAEKVGGRFEGEVAQMLSLFPKGPIHFDDPTWTGLTEKDIKKFSKFITSISAIGSVGVWDLLFSRTQKLSTKDGKVVRLEIIEDSVNVHGGKVPAIVNDDTRSLGERQTSDIRDATYERAEVPRARNNQVQPKVNDDTISCASRVMVKDEHDDNDSHDQSTKRQVPEDDAKVLAKELDSEDNYQIQIPDAPKSTLPEGFLYTIRNVLEEAIPDRRLFSISLQTVRKNIERLDAEPLSAGQRAWTLYKLTLTNLLLPTASTKDTKPKAIHSARLYYPNCQRFLRWDDIKAGVAETNTEKAVAKSLRAPPPSAETTKVDFKIPASSVSEVRKLLQLPSKPTSNPASISELEDMIQVSAEPRKSVHTAWAILVEISIGLCIVGLFFGLIAALTKFHAGDSSPTERAVMMTWLASGLYGFCLPLLSTLELLKVLFLLPLTVALAMATSMAVPGRAEGAIPYVIACLPLGLFIPPIWGFVLVGRMLTEWGDCVRLY
ncbi:MAG: hypothetical protein M1821_009910 [Bathelium mastoideum]|nr:MAG: hypothetical protein M1821_009910 [Bathelium mastoideum]KAI9690319.1 MAG: hypothetical protein M1822_009280 [Bathelium mastoideum]